MVFALSAATVNTALLRLIGRNTATIVHSVYVVDIRRFRVAKLI